MPQSIKRIVGDRRRALHGLLAVGLLLAVTAAAALAAPPGQPISQIEQELVDAVNAEREKAGLQPLIVNYSLMEASYHHNEHQAKIRAICHSGCGDGTPADRIRATGYKWVVYAENVAMGQPSVARVMVAWMNSAGHRANILGRFTDIGVAHTRSDTHYWTQKFATPQEPPAYVTVTPPAGHGRACELPADLNFDGSVTRADVDVVAARFMMTESDPNWEARFDLVPDGVINVYDVFSVVLALGQSCPR